MARINCDLFRAAMVVVGGMSLAGVASAATINFIGTTGSSLTDPLNWSGLPVAPALNTNPLATTNGNEHELVFDGSATSGTWAATSTYWYIRKVTFSSPDGFTMANPGGGLVIMTQDLPTAAHQTQPLVKTTLPKVYGMPGHSLNEPSLYELAGGSTLNINSNMANDSDMKVVRTGTGPAAVNVNYTSAGRALRLNLGEEVVFSVSNSNSTYANSISFLTGSGDVRSTGTNGRLVISPQDLNASGFTGTIRSIVNSNSNFLALGHASTDGNYTITGGRFIADTGGVVTCGNLTLQGSEISNTGASTRSRFTFANASRVDGFYATSRTLTASGVSLKPGTAGIAKIMEISGSVAFNEYLGANSTLYIDITGGGGVAGTDFDQLFVKRVWSVNGTGTATGGDVTSLTDATNRLADLNLVVSIAPTLTEADLAGDLFTIIRTDLTGLSFSGSQFANVTFTNGSATVNYNADGTVSLSSVAVPEPAILGGIAAGALIVASRRRRQV